MNVPVILKFTTRRTEAVSVKERVRQTGVIVTFSSDDGNCFAEATTTKTGKPSSRKPAHSSATDDSGDDNLLD